MIEHICLFKCKEELGEEGIEEIIRRFKRLRGEIPGLLEVSIGKNITEEKEFIHGYNLGMRMIFESHGHLRDYLKHPSHVKISKRVFESINHVSVCDFLIP